MKAPDIQTAVPVRRYALGDYTAVVLHDIKTREERIYRFILALVPFGEPAPVLFITAEATDEAPDRGDTIIRVIAESGERAFGPDARWRNLDHFTEDALLMARKVLRMEGEEHRRLQ